MTYRLAMPLSVCTTVADAQKLVESSDGAAIEVFIHNREQRGLKLGVLFPSCISSQL